MPANHKVSVAWQIVFQFIPIVNIWSFYRIRKLRRYLLYIVLPSLAIGIGYSAVVASITFDDASFAERANDPWFIFNDPFGIAVMAVSWALTGLQFYFIIVWSRQHNRQFDQQASQTKPTA